MEDIIEKAMKQARQDAKECSKGYVPMAQALIRYAEKHNFNPAQLYVMLGKIIKDMEEVDPTLKIARKIADKTVVDMKETVDHMKEIVEFAEELIDGL